ncbi:molybdenum cofactor biosynthesis protein MoaE [Compostibacter hankyongensis]|uniref:Molybdopterin synthase catalytic subunit n=1 Tax=Compostibacter hankyongensis TaxID=1007089 RepID=A0ABP8FLX1_9BACT
MLIKLVDDIDLNEAYHYLRHPGAGAVNLFIGTVRDQGQGKAVTRLSFEAYEEMALREMQKIGAGALEKWPLKKLLIVHTKGEKQVGEPVVVVGVSAPHRDVSFEACRHLIDTLKQRVPIWKKEFYTDQSSWINAHP